MYDDLIGVSSAFDTPSGTLPLDDASLMAASGTEQSRSNDGYLYDPNEQTRQYTEADGAQITEYWSADGSRFYGLTASYDEVGDSSGAWYGGGWVSFGTGASVSGNGEDSHASWGVGLGGGLRIGYSTDADTAFDNSQWDDLTVGGFVPALGVHNFTLATIFPVIVFDNDPFTLGLNLNFGIYQPIFEKKGGSGDPTREDRHDY